MILVIGGFAQGKLDYVLGRTGYTQNDIARDFKSAMSRPIFYGLHNVVAECLEAGGDPEEEIKKVMSENRDIIIICDELGCGVVPADPFERKWRDCVGRICCDIAARAHRVERIMCGLPMVLKGSEKWS